MFLSNIDNKGFNIYSYPWPNSESSLSSRVHSQRYTLPLGTTDWDSKYMVDFPLEYSTDIQLFLILIFSFTHSSVISSSLNSNEFWFYTGSCVF